MANSLLPPACIGAMCRCVFPPPVGGPALFGTWLPSVSGVAPVEESALAGSRAWRSLQEGAGAARFWTARDLPDVIDVQLVDRENGGPHKVTSIICRGLPERGMLTGLTYGLSMADHP